MRHIFLALPFLLLCALNTACKPGTYYPFGGGQGENPYYDPPKGYNHVGVSPS